jgi:hypothetical protein
VHPFINKGTEGHSTMNHAPNKIINWEAKQKSNYSATEKRYNKIKNARLL